MPNERPQIDRDLAERLGGGWFAMNGFDFLSLVYMISAEATQAALGQGRKDATDQEVVEAVTDAVNEWLNEKKDFILGFDTGEAPPARLAAEAARQALEPSPEGD